MYPTLFTLGPFSAKTFNLFLVLGLFIAAFTFWRRTKEEHYQEIELFDGFLLAVIMGLVSGRLGFVLTHWSDFGFNFSKWINVFVYGGFSGLIGLLGATFYLAFFAKRRRWDVFSILDYWVTSLSLGVGMVYLGLFFDSAGDGQATKLSWGVIFPGQLEPHHPVQLYWALFYLSSFLFLLWVEGRYRTFGWYRAGKKAAQTGFLTASFLIMLGAFSFLIALLKVSVSSTWFDYYLAGTALASGLILMAIRSNRFQFKKKKPPVIYVQKKS